MNMHEVAVVPGEGPGPKGTQVYLDGKQLQGVQAVTVHGEVNDLWTVTLVLKVSRLDAKAPA